MAELYQIAKVILQRPIDIYKYTNNERDYLALTSYKTAL